jgi:hypothetical protein
MSLPAHSGSRPHIQFLNQFSQTEGLLGRVISPSQVLYLNTRQHKHIINAYTHQTSMPLVGFEPTITESERAKTVHALDCAASVTGSKRIYCNVDAQSVSRQRLDKHVPVNTQQWKLCSLVATWRNTADNGGECFLCGPRRDRCYATSR